MTCRTMGEAKLDLAQFDLTDECPLFCSHCSNSSGPQLTAALEYGAVERAVVDAAELGCQNFIFSGGEPLRYAGLPRLLALCKRFGIRSTIFTTGVRNKETRLPLRAVEWAELSAFGLGTAVFSAYSSPENRAFHNRIVRLRPIGAADAFEANETGIVNAYDAGVSVEVQFVPSDETCSELSAVAGWAAKLGVLRLHLQYPTRQGRNAGDPSLGVSDRNDLILKEQALALSREAGSGFHVSRLWRSKWGIPSDGPQPTQLIVRSDGFAVRCNACKYTAEHVSRKNIHQQSLLEIWKDDNWRNAPCECSTQRVSKVVAASGRSGMQTVQSHGLLASSTQ
jgi:MoaA/NifB/PqqE/SkfB family radical SAM enzyme